MESNICITGALATVIGLLARNHPDCSVQIEWSVREPENYWFVTLSDGVNDTVYVVDDETGTHCPLSAHELARLNSNKSVFGES